MGVKELYLHQIYTWFSCKRRTFLFLRKAQKALFNPFLYSPGQGENSNYLLLGNKLLSKQVALKEHLLSHNPGLRFPSVLWVLWLRVSGGAQLQLENQLAIRFTHMAADRRLQCHVDPCEMQELEFLHDLEAGFPWDEDKRTSEKLQGTLFFYFLFFSSIINHLLWIIVSNSKQVFFWGGLHLGIELLGQLFV